MPIEFEISAVIPATADEIYHAWLDSEAHSAMTGGSAEASPEVGAAFSAWDGYLWGQNLELDPGKRILQTWRTVDFAEGDQDSLLEVTLEPVQAGTKVNLHHTNLPDDGGLEYKQGWISNYFEPMKLYFSTAE